MLQGNAIIGQSGGPTSVINASLAGIIEAARGQSAIARTLGMRYGIEGFMRGEVIDLGAEDPATIAALRTTPSSALGSCRHKLKEADFPKILDMLRRFDIRYFFSYRRQRHDGHRPPRRGLLPRGEATILLVSVCRKPSITISVSDRPHARLRQRGRFVAL